MKDHKRKLGHASRVSLTFPGPMAYQVAAGGGEGGGGEVERGRQM